ncbi:uncharacterized protein LOC125229163 [Leguminivora glycinivorella]|uniref:uncharacterized protein LOC125229163 n=1 Tax=Leguminivora glycinivorella TaxID=1035111 RepID=UPI00200D2092|nr:uncharacterized protein LOC125229163 [Leguminivora glycinivorella]
MNTQRTLHKHLHTNTHTNICQVNLQHCKDAMSELGQYVRRAKVEIALLQEPYAWRNRVAGLGHLGGALYYEGNGELPPRACIYVSNNVRNMGCFMTMCCRDLVVVETYFINDEGKRCKVALASCYQPGDVETPTKELEETVLR